MNNYSTLQIIGIGSFALIIGVIVSLLVIAPPSLWIELIKDKFKKK